MYICYINNATLRKYFEVVYGFILIFKFDNGVYYVCAIYHQNCHEAFFYPRYFFFKDLRLQISLLPGIYICKPLFFIVLNVRS